jgi:hypothetical protein
MDTAGAGAMDVDALDNSLGFAFDGVDGGGLIRHEWFEQ